MSEENTWPTKIYIYTDGASRGNPGPAALGVYIEDSDGNIVCEMGEKLGEQTNNFAEYTAVIRALEIAKENKVSDITLRSDSQLLIRQVNGQYKVKSIVIKPLYLQVKELQKSFAVSTFEHIRREFNTKSDHLANMALDGVI